MEHPIGNMMQTTMENIKDMVDVNTVIGEAVSTGEGMTVIPVSKVSFGFVAGGGEYSKDDKGKIHPPQGFEGKMPFAGGSGAGVSVQPVGFLVVGNGTVKMLPAQPVSMADRMVELLPQVVEDVKNMFQNDGKNNHKSTWQENAANPELTGGNEQQNPSLSQMNKGAPPVYFEKESH